MLLIPIIGPWLAFPTLAVGFSLLALSVFPTTGSPIAVSPFAFLQPIAFAIIMLGLF